MTSGSSRIAPTVLRGLSDPADPGRRSGPVEPRFAARPAGPGPSRPSSAGPRSGAHLGDQDARQGRLAATGLADHRPRRAGRTSKDAPSRAFTVDLRPASRVAPCAANSAAVRSRACSRLAAENPIGRSRGRKQRTRPPPSPGRASAPRRGRRSLASGQRAVDHAAGRAGRQRRRHAPAMDGRLGSALADPARSRAAPRYRDGGVLEDAGRARLLIIRPAYITVTRSSSRRTTAQSWVMRPGPCAAHAAARSAAPGSRPGW